MKKERRKHNRNRLAVSLLLAALIMPGMKTFVAYAEENQAEEMVTDIAPSITEGQQPQVEAGSVTATVGNVSRTVSLKVTPRENAIYSDWAGVGAMQTEEDLKATGALAGSGTAGDPWKIGKPEALAWFMAKVNAGQLTKDYQNVLLTANISLRGDGFGGGEGTPLEWVPISSYSGIFDGGNYEIDYLYGKGAGKRLGLINLLIDAVVQNVHIGANSELNGNTAAGIAATAQGGVNTIVDCINKGSMTADRRSAGLVGEVENGAKLNISRCGNEGKIVITGNGEGAGIVGWYSSRSGVGSVITDCYNSGEVVNNSNNNAAGIVGVNDYYKCVSVFNSYNVGILSGRNINKRYSIVALNVPVISNCFYYSGDGHSSTAPYAGADALTETQLKSWAAAYALNGQKMDGAWQYNEGEYPGFGTLAIASSWSVVAQGVRDGLIIAAEAETNENGAYVIDTAEKLALFALDVNDSAEITAHASLTANIDLTGTKYGGTTDVPIQWSAIGNATAGFVGTFDGNEHTIDRLYINSNMSYQGLFGMVSSGGTVKNVKIGKNSKVITSHQNAGGITGSLQGKIENCVNYGTVTGSAHVGGIAGIGNGKNASITRCGNWGNISATRVAAGIIGYLTRESLGTKIMQCYNLGTIKATGTSDARAGGICAGDDMDVVNGSTSTVFSSCYNAGIIESAGGDSVEGPLLVFWDGIQVKSPNSYYDSDVMSKCSSKDYSFYGKPLTTIQLQSWAAAYALNGQKMDGVWQYNEGEYPGFGTLNPAFNWSAVAQGVRDGLITADEAQTSEGGTYVIDTAEKLALFALDVNDGTKTAARANLTANIDLIGTEYGGTTVAPIRWMPIGSAEKAYQGTFESRSLSEATDTRKIYQIQNLYVSTTGTAGLFGTVSGGTIARIGLVNAVIAGSSAGGIAGNVTGAATIAQCYNRSGNDGRGSVTASENAGGIVGQTASGVIIRDCYNLETEIKGTGTSSGAGGIVGNGEAGTIRNSYSACDTTGSITSSGTAGAVNGKPGTGSGMSQCYSDIGAAGSSAPMADSRFVSQLYSTENARLRAQTSGLNTVNGTQQMKDNRIWYTSLTAEATKGWPTLEPPVKMISLGEVTSVDDASGSSGVLMELGTAGTIPDARFRYAGQETAGMETLSLAEWKPEYYTSWGTTSANGKIGLSGTVGDTAAMLKPEQMSLENPTQELGTISALKLYTGAAYAYPSDRDILVELSSGMDRYEIRFTIKGVTGKSLSVDLPIDVAMEELMPAGEEKTAHSVDVVMKNDHVYPIEGKILKVTPISTADRAGYRELKPIAKEDKYAGGQIYDSGVKLGITNPETGTGVISGELYYNPKAVGDMNPWVKYQLKAGGTFRYRYFMKYQSDPYYDGDHPNFGYTISYQFGVMADDYSAAAEAVAVQ